MNILVHLLAALIPLIIGFLWYSPKLFGNLWMREARVTEEMIKSGNMAVTFILSYVFSFILTIVLFYFADHVSNMQNLFVPLADHGFGVDPDSSAATMLKEKFAAYDARFGTFKHGAFHGLLLSIFLVLPLMATNAMFERKSFKYIMVNWGYWALTIVLMSAVLGQWA